MSGHTIHSRFHNLVGFTHINFARATIGGSEVIEVGTNARGLLLYGAIGASGGADVAICAKASVPTAIEQGALLITRNAGLVTPGIIFVPSGLGIWLYQGLAGASQTSLWYLAL